MSRGPPNSCPCPKTPCARPSRPQQPPCRPDRGRLPRAGRDARRRRVADAATPEPRPAAKRAVQAARRSGPTPARTSPKPTCAWPIAASAGEPGAGGARPAARAGAAPSRPRPRPRPAISTCWPATTWCSALGPAGTGKTFLAVAHGAGLLLRGEVDRLVVTRPAVEAGERLGFLPGDLNEKVDPYMAPICEALTDILGAEQLRRRRDKRRDRGGADRLHARPHARPTPSSSSTRPRTPSRLQMKMVLTRLGEGARMAVTGDPSQVDLLNPRRHSGLAHAVGHPGRRRGRGGGALRRRGRGAPPARRADRQRLRRRRGSPAR